MAFPWVLDEGHEAGTRGNFDSETDADAILDFPHYAELARWNMAPYRGAYCMRVAPNGGTNPAYIVETGAFDDLTADVTRHLRFYFLLGRNFTMADSDKISFFEAESVLNTTTEIACGIDRSGSTVRFWVAEDSAAAAQVKNLGDLTAPGVPGSCLNKWYCAELSINLDAGGGNDGTIDAYIDGQVVGSQIASLDQGAIVDAKFGIITGLAATTTGTILFDELRYDDTRVYPYKERFPREMVVDSNKHIFVGPGCVSAAALLTSTAGDIFRLWDTDVGNTDDSQGFKIELTAGTQSGATGPIYFDRGCYATITGTNPRGHVLLLTTYDATKPGMSGPTQYSERGMIEWGLHRKVRTGV